MRILVDIGHPAHFHFFENPLRLLKENKHEIIVTSRSKEMTLPLLENAGIEHISLSSHKSGRVLSLLSELIQRDINLNKVVKLLKPDVLTAIGGIFISHVGMWSKTPSVAFYDTENAKLQNFLTYPFLSKLVVPSCYEGWTPSEKTTRYNGYHELSYLHPKYFRPDFDIAIKNGLQKGMKNYLLRLVSWQANHDIGIKGISYELLKSLIDVLEARGNVIISSEIDLPPTFETRRFKGDVSEIHHLMAYCDGFVGESATMASESAVLGVPAVYLAKIGRGYTNEQELKYGLVKNVRTLKTSAVIEQIEWLFRQDRQSCKEKRDILLENTVDVAELVVHEILAS